MVTPPPDTPSGKAEPIAIKKITVEDFDFTAFEKQTPPTFAKVRIEGIAVSDKPAEGDRSEADGRHRQGQWRIFSSTTGCEPERKTLTLNRLELDLSGLARLELSMILDGVSPDIAGNPDAAMNDATLRTATLVFEDRSHPWQGGAGHRPDAGRRRCGRDAVDRQDDDGSAADRPGSEARRPRSTRSNRSSTITRSRKAR